MRILCATANLDSSYGNSQDWDGETPPAGYYQIADGTDETPLTSNGGFVALTLTGGIITAFTVDAAAWAAWQAAHPVVTKMPTTEDDILETVLDHEARLANMELLGGTT